MSLWILLIGFLIVPLGGYIVVRFPAKFAITLLVGAPVLLSTFPVGDLTLDNLVSAFGLVIGLGALVVEGLRLGPSHLIALFPIAVATAIVIANAVNEISFAAPATRYVSIAVLLVLVANSVRNGSAYPIAIARLLAAIGAISIILGQYFELFKRYADADSGDFRVGGLFGHPNFGAYVMCVILIYLLFLDKWTAIHMGEIALLLVGILLTGALAAALTMAVLWLVAVLWRRSVRDLVLATLAGLAVLPFGTLIMARLEAGAGAGSFDSLVWRLGQWQNLLNASGDQRVFGIGWQQSLEASGNGLGAHSAYVQALVEVGWVGSLLMLVGLLFAGRGLELPLTNVLIIAFVLVTSVTDPVLFYPSVLVVSSVVMLSAYPPVAGLGAIPPGGILTFGHEKRTILSWKNGRLNLMEKMHWEAPIRSMGTFIRTRRHSSDWHGRSTAPPSAP